MRNSYHNLDGKLFNECKAYIELLRKYGCFVHDKLCIASDGKGELSLQVSGSDEVSDLISIPVDLCPRIDEYKFFLNSDNEIVVSYENSSKPSTQILLAMVHLWNLGDKIKSHISSHPRHCLRNESLNFFEAKCFR